MSDAMVNGLSGAGGGIVAQLFTYPLQAVNTRQQTERIEGGGIKKLGTIRELYKVVADEGWGGLYRGLAPSLIGTIASQGVYYYFYQLFRDAAEKQALRKKRIGKGDGTVSMSASLVVAALAGSLNVLMTNPIWVIVTRMQTQAQAEKNRVEALGSEIGKPPHSRQALPADVEAQQQLHHHHHGHGHRHGMGHTVKELYSEAGLLGFWKGVLPTLVMVSNPALQFTIYETLLKRVTKNRKPNKLGLKDTSALEVFLLGSIGKLGATIATYPLLVVKSRLQAKQVIGKDKSKQYTGTLDAVMKMMKYEGVGGFYKGMSTKIVQSVAAAALLMMIKEELVKMARLMLIKKNKIISSSS